MNAKLMTRNLNNRRQWPYPVTRFKWTAAEDHVRAGRVVWIGFRPHRVVAVDTQA